MRTFHVCRLPVAVVPNAFVVWPWDGDCVPMRRGDVAAALSTGRLRDREYDRNPRRVWSRRDHIERVAFLVVRGWWDALDVLVSAGGMTIRDGWHRSTAAAYRGDDTVLVALVTLEE